MEYRIRFIFIYNKKMNIQIQLANLSFLFLLGSLIFYWISPLTLSFSGNKTLSLNNTMEGNMYSPQSEPNVSLNSSFSNENTKKNNFWGTAPARYGILLSNIVLFILLCDRWIESGHFPLSNLYESLMFLSWCFTTLHLFIENYTSSSLKEKESLSGFIGAITIPSALFTNAFATFTLPKEMQEAAPLVPALQSNWLMMHVTVMILSYSALILGSLLSIAFLIITSIPSYQPRLATTLDNLSYRILGIGFPFLTIGILSGAVWANEAWGSYWSWDPKETWALLTWLVFAIYLHNRITKPETEKNKNGVVYTENTEKINKTPAVIASFGFIVVWICYLGVNLIGEGLHSYGWIVS